MLAYQIRKLRARGLDSWHFAQIELNLAVRLAQPRRTESLHHPARRLTSHHQIEAYKGMGLSYPFDGSGCRYAVSSAFARASSIKNASSAAS